MRLSQKPRERKTSQMGKYDFKKKQKNKTKKFNTKKKKAEPRVEPGPSALKISSWTTAPSCQG